MAFTYTVDFKEMGVGRLKMAGGRFTNGGGDTGGDITVPGAREFRNVQLTLTGSAGEATAAVVNGTFPIAGSLFTIVTGDGDDGNWLAVYR